MIELTAYRGDSMSFTIPLTNGTAAFTPGGSYSLIFTAKRSSKDPDTAAVFQKSTATGTITTSTTNAIVTVLYTDTTTEDEPVLYWDIQAQHNSTAAVITAAKGTLTLVRDITRQTTASVPIYTVDPAAGGGGATPAGSTGSVQINNSGALAADSGLVYTGTGDLGTLKVGGGRIYMDATTGAIQANNVAIGGSNGVMPFANVTPAAGNVGSLNVSIGAGNFQAITTGDRNVACGSYSLYSLTTGSSNLGIGNNTLTNLTTGQRNTALGSGSGGPSTGNDNIFINSATDVYTTSNCQIVIAGTSDGPSSTVIGYDGRSNEVPTTQTRFIGNTIIWGDGVVGGNSPTASPNNRTSLVQTSSGSAKTISLPNVTGKLPVYTDTPAAGRILTATDDSGAATWQVAAGSAPTNFIDVTTAPYNAVGDGRLIDTFLNTSGNPTQGASMTSDSAVVTVTGGTFAAGDVGKYICIQGVGTLPTGTITATAGVITAVTLSTAGSVGAYQPNATIDFEVESLGSATPPTSEPIASASQASNVVTLVFSSPHGFNTGDLIDVTGITGSPSPNGRYTVTSTPLLTTLTYALSGSAGTYTVSSATANGVAITGANGVLRMTTDANGQAATLTIVNGGTLYANPALVFPETGLIGTITAYTNITTVTISRVAPSTFTLKPCFFGTDNSVAIQAALDAALASPTIKTVYIPTGIFLCNIQTYADINLIGAGGGIGLANNLTFANQIVNTRPQTNPTVLMPAVGYKPVIYAANGGGVISRMCIHGAPSLMNNIGFKLGTAYGSGFVSQGVNLNQLNFSGFKYALALARISTPILNNITGSYCRIAFYLTQPDESRYTDQISITGASFNFVKDYIIYSSGSKSITVTTSECSNCGRIVRLKNGAKLVVNGFNIENSPINFPNTATTNVDGDLFEVVGGAHLVLSAVRLANPSGWTNGAVIKEDLNRVNFAGLISVMSSDSGGSGMYRVNGSKYPNLLPKGAVISRWNSDFTTKTMSEISTRAYAGAGKMGRYKSWDEYFPTNPPSNKMVTAASLATNVVTLTTSIAHGMSTGMQVIVDGVGFTTVNPNGTFIVVSAPTTTTLTYAVTGTSETYTVTGRSFVTVEGLGYQNGFCVTNIGATNIVRDRLNGAFHLKSVNTAASTGFRIAQEYESIPAGSNWELKFDVNTSTTIYTPNIRFGLYDLSSATLNPNNGIGILISNTTDLADPDIFLEVRANGSTASSVNTGIKYLTAGGSASISRKILVLTRFGNQITLTVHGGQESGYVPYAQCVWSPTISNPSLYYSPAIYLGNNTTRANWQEMYVNSIKYQELNADLL